jgi:hypothetical protein
MWQRETVGTNAFGRVGSLVCFALTLLVLPLTAAAEQHQDWLLSGTPDPGTFVNLDVAFGGVQAGLEHRIDMYGKANQLTLRGSALAALPYGNAQLDADLRLVILFLGTSIGAQDVWRNQTFAPRDSLTRSVRLRRENAGQFDSDTHAFWEGRAQLVLPFNDYLLFNNVSSYRITGAPERTFDHQIGVVHDGNYLRSDFQLWIKHPEVGGIAPLFQLLNFPLDGVRHTQLNVGFIALSRAALVRRDDFVVFQMLFHAGSALGGYDNREVYGLALLRAPITLTLAYRSVISL